ncbi:response regulator [Noviherbaspirillum massiliense]|uniref:response regulator n=1 Tax=Noviherbaspirillum massiliense TaxID=1465823 RepID=UPI000552EA96|nr:response regulator transcription factor [Noviherbaspirillum massiliense]
MLQKTAGRPLDVMVVEDDPVTRKTLCLGIKAEPSLRLAADFDNIYQALTWLETGTVDVLLTDLGLPDGSGLEVIKACARNHPHCDIMVVTISSDEENVLASIEAGASGYILKDAGRIDVARSILDMRAGGAPMSPTIARMVLAKMRNKKPEAEAAAVEEAEPVTLTKREAAILELIAHGGSYGEVARVLSVSVGTVQTHIKNIYAKLSVHSRGEAVFEAHRRGLLQLGRPKPE